MSNPAGGAGVSDRGAELDADHRTEPGERHHDRRQAERRTRADRDSCRLHARRYGQSARLGRRCRSRHLDAVVDEGDCRELPEGRIHRRDQCLRVRHRDIQRPGEQVGVGGAELQPERAAPRPARHLRQQRVLFGRRQLQRRHRRVDAGGELYVHAVPGQYRGIHRSADVVGHLAVRAGLYAGHARQDQGDGRAGLQREGRERQRGDLRQGRHGLARDGRQRLRDGRQRQ
ncbi:hypothetical protein BCPG_04859 [Burkholderia cenocepacia PC184]|nr:hypothetical protein BCPG_04859 [Burkholderia cenocepacia PC184]